MNTTTIKIAHNIAFESSMAYARGIVIQAPVYDTICASQMSLKSIYEFRKLNESGLKKLAEELFGEPLPSFSSVTDGKHFDELDAQDEETVRYGSADSDFALRLYHKFNDWFGLNAGLTYQQQGFSLKDGDDDLTTEYIYVPVTAKF